MKQIKENAKTKMEKSINVMLSDFAGIRAGRANPSVLNKVQVEYYGAMTPVTQMAAVSVAEARVLVIQPWDKSTLKPIEKFKAMKKNNEITEDDLKDCEDEIQKLTDRFVKEVDGHVAEKEKEILSI